ncbi:MAG: SsrA-binding protein SmpB [Phormidesmis priestleyi Ana]|uniref:SsrA-binding protein n=1 Tax=Phormidesmis priestleyi Ana TaxID=1666911 RepID=A0A0P8DGW0_9CYAN|nr:MAG: SsrA-binding protein SmpB [Phormidesmis priestleyi Ana]
MANSSKDGGVKIVADNRQARYEYEILETYEAGVALLGTEVKSIREGKVNLRDGFANVKRGEAWLHNVHISPHKMTNLAYNHEPRRVRKLLLHRQEIRKLIGQTEQKGLTLIPLKMYFKDGRIKVVIGLSRGKKLHDKRESLKKKQDKREMARVMKSANQ